MAAVGDGDSEAGPATPAGPGIDVPADVMVDIRNAEDATRKRIAAEEKVEVLLSRRTFGDSAYAGQNGVGIRVVTGRRVRVPASFAKLLMDRQEADERATAASERNAAGRR